MNYKVEYDMAKGDCGDLSGYDDYDGYLLSIETEAENDFVKSLSVVLMKIAI